MILYMYCSIMHACSVSIDGLVLICISSDAASVVSVHASCSVAFLLAFPACGCLSYLHT